MSRDKNNLLAIESLLLKPSREDGLDSSVHPHFSSHHVTAVTTKCSYLLCFYFKDYAHDISTHSEAHICTYTYTCTCTHIGTHIDEPQ